MDRTMRITMIGASGSGKSSFLSGVQQTMVNNDVGGLKLLPSGTKDERYGVVGSLADNSILVNGGFSPGTNETREYVLSLTRHMSEICKFHFIDYRGGSIDDMFRQKTDPDVLRIRDYIQDSDAVLVFADSLLLDYYKDVDLCRLATKADKINSLFDLMNTDFTKKHMSVLLVLTKSDSDMISPVNKAIGCLGLTNQALKAFRGVYECVKDHQRAGDAWSFGVIPVSAVGEGNAETRMIDTGDKVTRCNFACDLKEGRVPHPHNIDAAMVYSICRVLKAWEDEYRARLKEMCSDLESAIANDTVFGKIKNRIANKPAPKAQARQQIEMLKARESEALRLNEDLKAVVEAVKPFERVSHQMPQGS